MAAQLDLVDASSSLDNDTPGESPLKLAATLSRSQQFPWYQQSFGSLFTPECRQLLERYSRIAPAEVESHVYKMVKPPTKSHLPVALTNLAIQSET